MKNNRFNSIFSSAILSSAIAMGLFASAGSAQVHSDYKLQVDIPFAFQAGSSQMPAGVYRITLEDHVVVFEDLDAGKNVSKFLTVTPSHDGKLETNARLIFQRYGDRYFLREVWQANSMEGITCSPSSGEKGILRAQNQQAVPRTQLAVNAEPVH